MSDTNAVPSTDEYYRLKIAKNALVLLRAERGSDGVELATINAMIAETDVLIGRNRCCPSNGKHSDDCDGACEPREPFPMVADENDDPKENADAI